MSPVCLAVLRWLRDRLSDGAMYYAEEWRAETERSRSIAVGT